MLIPATEMQQLLTESSTLTHAMWWSTMTDSAVLREWIVNHGKRDARERIAHIFCELMIRYRMVDESVDNSVPFALTQEELSDATGMTSVHVNRVLGQLRAEGLIDLNSKVLTVLDFERLKAVAQYDPSYLHLIRTERGVSAVKDRPGWSGVEPAELDLFGGGLKSRETAVQQRAGLTRQALLA